MWIAEDAAQAEQTGLSVRTAGPDPPCRASRRLICQPAAVSGEEVAARAQQRSPYANSRDPSVTGALGTHKSGKHAKINEEDESSDD